VKVTVVTACFNSARTIAATLQSVARQTHPDIEHIVVDGGSRDGTLDVLSRHGERVSKVLHGPDQGIYDALNKGVAASAGEIIGCLHSDDVYARDDVIETVVARMSQELLDAVYGDVAFIRGDDRERVVRRYSSRHFKPSRLAWGWMPAHPALFVSKRLFDRYGPFKTDYKIAGDFEFVARVFARPAFRYAYLPEVLVLMRTGGVSTPGWRSMLVINREFMRACRENGIGTNYFKLLSRYPAKMLEFLPRTR
jgi:glycosyltransferase involved in cell wall biosynthesis